MAWGNKIRSVITRIEIGLRTVWIRVCFVDTAALKVMEGATTIK